MSTQSALRTDRIELSSAGPRPIVLKRSITQLSSDAGLLLFRQFDERRRWTERFAACLADDRSAPRHSLESMVRQRVFGIIAGYEDCNDHDSLRDEPVFKLIADRLPSDPALASQPTLSRFENAVSTESLQKMIDLTAALGVDDDLERVVAALHRANPTTRVHVRADAGVGSPALYNWCDRGEHLFPCGLGPNSKLSEWAAPLLARAQRQYARTGIKQRLFAVRRYQARTWDRLYWVIAKAECGIEGTNLRFMVTNAKVRNKSQAEKAYDFYARRGESEHRFDELKNGLSGDRLSCHRFKANFLRLLLHTMAANLLSALRDEPDMPAELRVARPATWRTRIVKVAACVIESTRRIWLEISSSWPHWELLRQVAQSVTHAQVCARGP